MSISSLDDEYQTKIRNMVILEFQTLYRMSKRDSWGKGIWLSNYEEIIDRISFIAFKLGVRYAFNKVLTINEVSEVLVRSPRQIRQIAKRRGVGRKLPKQWLFLSDDIDKLRPGKRGRPPLKNEVSNERIH